MRNRFLVTLMVLAGLSMPPQVQASTVINALSDARLRGEATFRFIGLPLYEARLFTKGGAALDWKQDFGLELKYLRNLTQYDLVEGTIRELKRTGGAMPRREKLERCYTDVRKGDRYAAVSSGPNRLDFWLNGKRICTLEHPRIKQSFMAIFLGNNTRSKSFTRKLKGY